MVIEAAIENATALEPGAVVGILDTAPRLIASGFHDLERTRPMLPDSIFRIDSLTKPVVAVALLVLVQERRLSLDEPILRWVPELASPRVLVDPMGNLDRTVPAFRDVRLIDVLTSRIGTGIVLAPPRSSPIQRKIDDLGMAGFGPPMPDSPQNQDEWIARLASLPLMAHPGEAWFYNVSSLVQGLLIARISGMSLSRFLQERVFTPLDMCDTGFSVTDANKDRLVPAFRSDLILDDPGVDGAWSTPPKHEGAGGLVSTVPDFLNFVEMLHGRRPRLISDDMLTLMLTDHLTTGQRSEASPLLDGKGWGFGLSVEPGCLPQAALSGRVGWAGGAGTSWSSDLGQDKAVVVFSNRALDAPEVYAGHQTIHRAILG